MATLRSSDDEIKTVDMVFAYWLRTIISTARISHDDLLKMVLKYYFIPRFEWDPEWTHKDLMLSYDRKRFTKWDTSSKERRGRHGDDWRSLCSANMLSADTDLVVRWEMTLQGKRRGTAMNLTMGFVDAVHIEEFPYIAVANRHQLYFTDGSPIGLSNGHRTTCPFKGRHPISKKGDTFRLDFDFQSKGCTAFYNNELLGSITKKLPERIHLTASVNMDGTSLETTLFEITNRKEQAM